jgi:hypothetical protein
MRSSEVGDAGGAFRAALLENANLGGDCTHRGALLGAILGMTLGASNLPRDLVDGLVRGAAVAPHIFSLAATVESHGANAPRRPPRFGRPSPLPVCDVNESTSVRAPRDLESKATAIRSIRESAARAAVDARDDGTLLFIRGVGACTVARGGKDFQKRLVPVFSRAATSPPPQFRLDEGRAACDAAAVLSALAAGRSSTGAVPSAESMESSLQTGPILLAANAALDVTLEEAHVADIASVSPIDSGCGVFFFGAPSDLAARLHAVAAARARSLAASEPPTADVVRERLRLQYGVDIPFAASWLQHNAAPPPRSGVVGGSAQ